jgi:hypothetical protein
VSTKSNLPFIPVVCYHSIGPVNKNWNRNFLTLELPFFEDQLRYFKENFQTIFLKEYWNIRSGNTAMIKKSMVITFDDGFLDNWIWAFPLLRKYNLKATIFVCPEFVDSGNEVRLNLEDLWKKKATIEEITLSGYLNWPEMKAMISSGLIDIQSHTMSHTKYFVSDKITGFHSPGNDCLYIIGNLLPHLKPYHITDTTFEKQVPYGYPVFEEVSSVCARRVTINQSFSDECIRHLAHYDFSKYAFSTAFNEILDLYHEYKADGLLITGVESDESMMERLNYEITGSKKILEDKLQIPIQFLCWPHGDNTDEAHRLALKAGYLATTSGGKFRIADTIDRIPERIGLRHVRNNRFLSLLKAKYKMESSMGTFPYQQVKSAYNMVRYGKISV